MDALLLAILNALWQGTALIALVALALRLGLRRNATTACVMWSVTFLVVAVLPFIDVALAHRTAAPALPPTVLPALADLGTGPVRVVVVDGRRSTFASQPAATTTPAVASSAVTAAAATAAAAKRVRDGATWLGSTATAFARTWGFLVVDAWMLVAASLLLRLAFAYAAIGRMKRDALPLDDPSIEARLRAAGHRRRATVATSPNVTVPCAIGFRRPMILIPAGLAASLDSDDLARIVLHESAHLQRYDDWGNALEQAVCALQFFQPALHVARRRIDFEREVACDDRVLAAAGEPLRYAECLARMAQRQARLPRVAFVPGFVLRRAHVVARVRRIVDRSRDASPRLRLAALALGAGVLVATLGITRLQVPLVTPAAAAPVHAIIVALAKVKRTDKIAKKTERKDAKKAAKVAKRTAPTAGRVLIVAEKVTLRSAKAQVTARNAVLVGQSTDTVDRHPHPHPKPNPQPHPGVKPNPDPNPHPNPAVHVELDTNIAPDAQANAPVAELPMLRREAVMVAVNTQAAINARIAVVRDTPYAPRVITRATAARTGDLLDAIDEAKYPHPSVDELITLHNQGVTGDYVRKMGAIGPTRPTLQQLLALAVQGITPDYVTTMNLRLTTQPTVDQLIELRTQGVSMRWLNALADTGYRKLSIDDAVALASHGVSSTYVRDLMYAGFRDLTPQQLVALRTSGVDGTYARQMARHGYHSIDDLIRLKQNGVEP